MNSGGTGWHHTSGPADAGASGKDGFGGPGRFASGPARVSGNGGAVSEDGYVMATVTNHGNTAMAVTVIGHGGPRSGGMLSPGQSANFKLQTGDTLSVTPR